MKTALQSCLEDDQVGRFNLLLLGDDVAAEASLLPCMPHLHLVDKVLGVLGGPCREGGGSGRNKLGAGGDDGCTRTGDVAP